MNREQAIVEHLPIVQSIAVRMRESLPANVELDDLVHAGILGLMDAVDKHDPERKAPLSAYARHRIRGEMIDSLRRLDWATRHMRLLSNRIERCSRELAGELKRDPAGDEVAERMGIETERWHRIRLAVATGEPYSATSRKAGEEPPALDFPAPIGTRPDAMYAHREMQTVVATALDRLPGRYRKVVTMYYFDGLTMKEIAAQLGVNESRISQIHIRALAKMRRALCS